MMSYPWLWIPLALGLWNLLPGIISFHAFNRASGNWRAFTGPLSLVLCGICWLGLIFEWNFWISALFAIWVLGWVLNYIWLSGCFEEWSARDVEDAATWTIILWGFSLPVWVITRCYIAYRTGSLPRKLQRFKLEKPKPVSKPKWEEVKGEK